MDNSLSLAEIDRIIGNLIGKEGDHSLTLEADQHQSYVSDLSPHGLDSVDKSVGYDPLNASAHFDDVPAAARTPQMTRGEPSAATQRLVSPKSHFTSPLATGMNSFYDSPTDVPSYVSPLPVQAGSP